MELIRLENVYKTYHLGEVEVPVLRGVSLSIRQGEMVALMGASGSGKTTLMNILGCLDHATSGKYWLDGQEMSGLTPNQRALVRTEKLGFVFQNFNLLARTTALQNVVMPLDYSPRRRSSGDARRLAKTLLDESGWPTGPITSRRRCPADSNNEWRSAAPWSIALRWCWPTSRPATLIRTRASKSCGCSSNSTRRESPSSW